MILAPFYPLHLTKSQVLCKTGLEPVGLIHILAFHPISALWRGPFTVTARVSLVQPWVVMALTVLLVCWRVEALPNGLKPKTVCFQRVKKAKEFPNALSQSHIWELGWVEAVECFLQLLAWRGLLSHQGAPLVALETRMLGLAWIQLCISPMQLLMFLGMASSFIKSQMMFAFISCVISIFQLKCDRSLVWLPWDVN